MLSSKDLNTCIENLTALINAEKDNDKKKLLIEIGFILKQEYDLITSKEERGKIDTKNSKFDVKLLLEDNKQLFMENQSLLTQNMNLKKIIDNNIPQIKQMYENILSLTQTL